jgi:hypothetical protein
MTAEFAMRVNYQNIPHSIKSRVRLEAERGVIDEDCDNLPDIG